MRIGELAYKMFMGLPMIGWGGIITLALLILTFSIGFLNHRGIRVIPFKYHKPAAAATLLFGVVHGAIGVLSNLGF